MKLKTVLMIAFLILTLLPIIFVSVLLYKSGFNLSKELYTQNLVESINVQADYISQTLQDDMIEDFRFAAGLGEFGINNTYELYGLSSSLADIIRSYLSVSEDKLSVCILLDKKHTPVYTIGDSSEIIQVINQVPDTAVNGQFLTEFQLLGGAYCIGVVTPFYSADKEYAGMLVSVYDKKYVLKIISSYYKVSGTAIYICRENGDIIDMRGESDPSHHQQIKMGFYRAGKNPEGLTDLYFGTAAMRAYYKNIDNLPWSLVGIVDYSRISLFINKFIRIYILITLIVVIVDIVLSLYFSQKVVEPINRLIKLIEGYPASLDEYSAQNKPLAIGYYETNYLNSKFQGLMKAIRLTQHNFEGVFQLYQSGAMDDINIDIDVKNQMIRSNSEEFDLLLHGIQVRTGACIVERFTNCFCENDQKRLLSVLEDMRDKHLSVNFEGDVYTPYMQQKWYRVVIVPMYEKVRLSRLFVQLRDISSFKKQELKSQEQAKRDPLTNLYNRAGLSEYVQKILVEETVPATHALLFIDMNYFKMVNDNFGHSAGDALLRSIADILQSAVSELGLAARIGGDEFILFLQNAEHTAAEKLKKLLEEKLVFPFTNSRTEFVVSASIGLAIWKRPSDKTFEDLLDEADGRMYTAKREFKQQSSTFRQDEGSYA